MSRPLRSLALVLFGLVSCTSLQPTKAPPPILTDPLAGAPVFSLRWQPLITVSAEAALASAQGIDWLMAHRNADGAWAESPSPILTCAVSFMAAVNDPRMERDAAFRDFWMASLSFLLQHQEADGHFRSSSSSSLRPIEQAAATQALSFRAHTSNHPRFYKAAERAADYLLAQQQVGGGWGDGYTQGRRRSTPITASQMEALFSAAQAGVRGPEITAALQRAAMDLLAIQDPDTGRFGSYFRGVGPALITGHALAGLQWAGWGLSRPARRGWLDLESPAPAGSLPLPLLAARHTLYAAAQQGGPVARDWTEQVFNELLSTQAEDGSWKGPGKEASLGTAYATAQCAWMLSGFRHAPHLFAESTVPEPGPSYRIQQGASTVYVMPSTFLLPEDRFLLDRDWATILGSLQSFSTGPSPRTLAYEFSQAAEHSASGPLPADILESLHLLYSRWVVSDAAWNGLPPWAIALFLMGDVVEQHGIHPDALPEEFLRRQGLSSIPSIREIVPSAAYVDAITALPDEMALDFLRRMLAHRDRIPPLLDAAAEAWRMGDQRALEQTIHALAELAGPAWAPFIQPLNRRWREEIQRCLEMPGDHLVVVPAIHLPAVLNHE